jgi:poly-gamma-glutamate synthesis protein (capsule biosynthesis protein)
MNKLTRGTLLSLIVATALVSNADARDYVVAPAIPPGPAALVSFSRACESASDQLVIAAMGDILPHASLAEQAYANLTDPNIKDERRRIGFETLWRQLSKWIHGADVAYANLEGPAARQVLASGIEYQGEEIGMRVDGQVYAGTDMVFNYHPVIVRDLKRSGFTIISGANNHALDRDALGADRTIEAFEAERLPFVGMIRSSDVSRRASIALHTRVRVRDWTIAWIACTEHTNFVHEENRQVLRCGEKKRIVNEIKNLRADPQVDAVIVSPHWGEEYEQLPREGRQIKLAQEFADAGADAVIGSHPHVLQPIEKIIAKDGREVFVAYSLGNFVSGQGKRPAQKLSVVLYLGLSKRPGERAWINGIRYLPIWMNRGPHSVGPLETTRQAPKDEVYQILHALFDPARELKVSEPIRANFECP